MSVNETVALYDPNLLQLLNVKVLGLVIAASHDKGSTCSERRHMIDLYCLKMLEGGDKLLAAMVPAAPACTVMAGRGMEGQRVLGMLNCPLKARCDRESRFVHVILDDVLVVDRLPVPLHISIQQLEADFTPGLKTLTSYNSTEDADNFRLKRENVPEHYHSHPFYDIEGPRKETAVKVGGSDVAAVVVPGSLLTCGLASCGVKADKDQKLMVCSRCRRIAYCCAEHQAKDWKRHKVADACMKPV